MGKCRRLSDARQGDRHPLLNECNNAFHDRAAFKMSAAPFAISASATSSPSASGSDPRASETITIFPSGDPTRARSQRVALGHRKLAIGTSQPPSSRRTTVRSAMTRRDVSSCASGASSRQRDYPFLCTRTTRTLPARGEQKVFIDCSTNTVIKPRRLRPAHARMMASNSPASSFARRVFITAKEPNLRVRASLHDLTRAPQTWGAQSSPSGKSSKLVTPTSASRGSSHRK